MSAAKVHQLGLSSKLFRTKFSTTFSTIVGLAVATDCTSYHLQKIKLYDMLSNMFFLLPAYLSCVLIRSGSLPLGVYRNNHYICRRIAQVAPNSNSEYSGPPSTPRKRKPTTYLTTAFDKVSKIETICCRYVIFTPINQNLCIGHNLIQERNQSTE